MSKISTLKKLIIRDGVGVTVALAVCAGIGMGAASFAESAAQKKSSAMSVIGQEQGQLTNFQMQLSKSGTAEKRYVEIVEQRDNQEFKVDSEAFKDSMRLLSAQYRFQETFKLNLAPEKKMENPEFSGLNFDVTQREAMRMEFSAMSDMHVFSFLQQLLHETPGLLKITQWKLMRQKDLEPSQLQEMATGRTPEVVKAEITFNWIGIAEKSKDAASQNANPGAPPPPPPPM